MILFEDGGIITNETTGFSTINQLAKSVLCGTDKGLQGCTVNDRCCKCATGSCSNEKIIDDLVATLKIISKSTVLHLGQVATTVNDLISDVKDLFKKTEKILPREKLVKNITKTFTNFEKIVLQENEAIGTVSGQTVGMLQLIQLDLVKITEAKTVESKNSAANDLGYHIIFLLDTTAEILKILAGVCNITDTLTEGIYSIILVTTTVLFFVQQSITTNAVQVNKVGFRNDTASHICLHVSIAVEQYVVVVEKVSQCPNIQSLKELMSGSATALLTARTQFSDGVGRVIQYVDKYPVSPTLFGFIDCIMNCIRGSKQLKDAETVISETLFTLLDVCKSILAARFSCFCINGFTAGANVLIRNILVYLHTIVFMIANIDDGAFSCGKTLSMLLAIMNSIILKIMDGVEELMQSILILGEITDGSKSLVSAFGAVVDVASSVVLCVAELFYELGRGSHLIDIPKALPHLMLHTKSQIIVARDRLNKGLEDACKNYQYNSDTFIETSLVILSFKEFKRNIGVVATELDCSKGDDTDDDAGSTKVDIIVGKLRSSAGLLSIYGAADVAEAVNGVCDETYDTLIRLSSISLTKGEMLKVVSVNLFNYYSAVFTLNSISNCVHDGVNSSLF